MILPVVVYTVQIARAFRRINFIPEASGLPALPSGTPPKGPAASGGVSPYTQRLGMAARAMRCWSAVFRPSIHFNGTFNAFVRLRIR